MTVLKQYLGGPLGLSLYVFMLQICNITPLEKKPANGSLRSWRGRTTRKMLHFGGVRRCGGKRHSVSLPPPRLLKAKCTPPDMRHRKGGGRAGQPGELVSFPARSSLPGLRRAKPSEMATRSRWASARPLRCDRRREVGPGAWRHPLQLGRLKALGNCVARWRCSLA
uniref:Uncharacterized protein n=1 Tax=Rousettus aegyptiacus TaxID=9407 RepID=A0A7J8E8V0_ROUAE|nr:hypothetical protein HJG63_008247 [Rousettus aegyptiacus]